MYEIEVEFSDEPRQSTERRRHSPDQKEEHENVLFLESISDGSKSEPEISFRSANSDILAIYLQD